MARQCFGSSHKTMKDFRAIVDRKLFIFLAFLGGSVLSVTGRDVKRIVFPFSTSKCEENASKIGDMTSLVGGIASLIFKYWDLCYLFMKNYPGLTTSMGLMTLWFSYTMTEVIIIIRSFRTQISRIFVIFNNINKIHDLSDT